MCGLESILYTRLLALSRFPDHRGNAGMTIMLCTESDSMELLTSAVLMESVGRPCT